MWMETLRNLVIYLILNSEAQHFINLTTRISIGAAALISGYSYSFIQINQKG